MIVHSVHMEYFLFHIMWCPTSDNRQITRYSLSEHDRERNNSELSFGWTQSIKLSKQSIPANNSNPIDEHLDIVVVVIAVATTLFTDWTYKFHSALRMHRMYVDRSCWR